MKISRFTLAFVALASLGMCGDDCDEKKPTEGAPAAAVPPTPEKLAGMGEGALRVCAIPKADMSDVPISITFPEQSEKPVRLELKKTDKGYCEYWRAPSLSRLWWNSLQFTSDANLTEVGVYYTPKYHENPKAEDLAYAKAVQRQDGSFRLNVRVISETTPSIEVHAVQ